MSISSQALTLNSIGHYPAGHEILSLKGADGESIKGRYWQSPHAKTLIVFVHGVVSHSLWLSNIAEELLKSNINSLAIDRRGTGMNHHKRGHADNIAQLLADLDIVDRWVEQQALTAHLCGFCWGSNYAINSLQHGTKTYRSLLLLAPSIFPAESLKNKSLRMGQECIATEEPVMPIDKFTEGAHYRHFILPDPLRLKKVSPSFNRCMHEFSQGIWMKFLRIQLPCLLILGKHDAVVDNTATIKLFKRLKTVDKYQVSLDAHHGIQFDQPIEASQIISEWVQRTQFMKAS